MLPDVEKVLPHGPAKNQKQKQLQRQPSARGGIPGARAWRVQTQILADTTPSREKSGLGKLGLTNSLYAERSIRA